MLERLDSVALKLIQIRVGKRKAVHFLLPPVATTGIGISRDFTFNAHFRLGVLPL